MEESKGGGEDPCSNSKTFVIGSSDNLAAKTEPAEPPPTTNKKKSPLISLHKLFSPNLLPSISAKDNQLNFKTRFLFTMNSFGSFEFEKGKQTAAICKQTVETCKQKAEYLNL